MKPSCSVLLLGLFVAGNAHAQLLETVPVPPPASTGSLFDQAFQPYPRSYAGNSAWSPNARLFNREFTTDPRLLFGVSLDPNVALEAGYIHLLDRGFHMKDPRDPRDTSGALGDAFASHAAIKYTVPLSTRLSVYGKMGAALSRGPVDRKFETDKGLYLGLGGRMKIDRRTTVRAEFANHGNAARRFGGASGASKLQADVKIGF